MRSETIFQNRIIHVLFAKKKQKKKHSNIFPIIIIIIGLSLRQNIQPEGCVFFIHSRELSNLFQAGKSIYG